MSNWINNNELDIKNTFERFIPEEFNGFTATDAFLTTYSLDTDILGDILYQLKILNLVGKDKVNVFYDFNSRCMEKSSKDNKGSYIGTFIRESRLHGIRLTDNEKIYAFHPKMILIRYIKEETVKYLTIISSKNISDSDLVDAYAVAWGEVAGENEKNNGKALSDIWSSILNKAGMTHDITEELKKVSFAVNGKEVEFFDAKGVYDRISKLDKLTVVSPFLSDGIVNGLNNIELLVSDCYGYSMLDNLKFNGSNCDKPECHVFSKHDTQNLHAKIYCWEISDSKKEAETKNKEAYWIIGSSNATVNGLNKTGKSKNIEFNIGFKTDIKELEDFREYMRGLPELTQNDYNYSKSNFSADKSVDLFSVFCNEAEIECNTKDGKYSCTISINDENGKAKDFVNGFRISPDSELLPLTDNKAEITGDKPFAGIIVGITIGDNKKKEFYLSVYDKWDDKTRAKIDSYSDAFYLELYRRIIARLSTSPRKPTGISDTIRNISTGQKSNQAMKKYSLYERMMDIVSEGRDLKSGLTEYKSRIESVIDVNETIRDKLKDIFKELDADLKAIEEIGKYLTQE